MKKDEKKKQEMNKKYKIEVYFFVVFEKSYIVCV